MKKVTLLSFGVLVFISAFNKNPKYQTSPSTPPQIIKEKEHIRFDSAMFYCQQIAKDLADSNQISVKADYFAKMLLVKLYCESAWKCDAIFEDGQGISQFTADTRKRLGMPDDITNVPFRVQIQYVKKFLIATGKLKRIKSVEQLHALNFSPANCFRDTICSAKNLPQLDFNKDSVITLHDLRLFEQKRVLENKRVKKIYEEINGKTDNGLSRP